MKYRCVPPPINLTVSTKKPHPRHLTATSSNVINNSRTPETKQPHACMQITSPQQPNIITPAIEQTPACQKTISRLPTNKFTPASKQTLDSH